MDSFTVTNILEYGDNDVRPVIVEFQNGQLNSTHVHHELYNVNKKTFVKIETKMTYKGEVKRDTVCNNFLVVADNNTGDATLVPIDYALLAPDINLEDENNKDEADDYSSAVRTLKKEFGSKRTKLMAQQEERMRMNTANTTKSLQEAVTEMEIDEDDLETTTDTPEATYIPPINRDAESVEEVYNVYSLIPKGVLDALDGEVLNDFSSVIYTDLVKNHIYRKLELEPTDTVELHCKILLVIDCILNFLLSPLKIVSSKKYTPCEYSMQLSSYVLSTFTLLGRNGRNRSNSMKDKAMCYCIVLLALVNNYKVNLDELSKALKLKVNKLQNIAKLLAFVPANAKDKTNVILKLPLPPPVKNLIHTPQRKR